MCAWFDRNNAAVPEKLRSLDQTQLEAAVDFYNANKDKVTQLESELDTTKKTLGNVTTEFEATKGRVAQLEASANQPKGQQQPPPQDQAADWLTEPDKAFIQNVKPLADLTLSQGSQLAQLRIETHLREKGGRDLKLYHKYRSEIMELMKNEPPVNQTNPNTWMNAYNLVKGNHFDDIMAATTKGDAEFFGEQVTRSNPDQPNPEKEITDTDKLDAKRFGVTEEAVRDARLKIKIGEPQPQQA
jgi:hypothetical protein